VTDPAPSEPAAPPNAPALERLSIRAYARRRGVSHTAVRRAIETARIREGHKIDERGRPYIVPAVADREWSRNTDAAQSRARAKPDDTPAPAAVVDHPAQAELFETGARARSHADDADGPSLARVQARRVAWLAELAEIEVRQRMGKLGEVAAFRAEAFKVGRVVRESLENLADRWADELAGMTDRNAIRSLLISEIKKACLGLADVLAPDGPSDIRPAATR
jgi:hypothetical protein